MEVRKVKLEDIDRVFELLNILYSGKIQYDGFKKRYIKKLGENKVFNIVAVENNQIIGVLTSELHEKLHRNNLELFIEDLIVDEKKRSKGIGTALLNEAIIFARKNHCEVVELTSYNDNDKAHEFYQKNGFINHSIDFKKYLLK